jgi:hypothetical protein
MASAYCPPIANSYPYMAPASTDDRQFQLTPPMGQFLHTTNLFDDEAFFPLRKFLPHSKQVIDLTLDSDGDNDDEDAIEVGQLLNV